MRYNIIKQLAILTKFHDQEEFTFRFNNFVQLYNIGMPNFLQNLDLSTYPLDVLFIFDSGLLEDLDGHFLAGQRVHC